MATQVVSISRLNKEEGLGVVVRKMNLLKN